MWRHPESAGSNVGFLENVSEHLGLKCEKVSNLTEGLEALKGKAGRALLVCTALRKSPYTNSSHFVVVAGVDEEYMYVLDPMRRTKAKYAATDTRELLDLLGPGVTRNPLSRYGYSDLSVAYYMERTDVPDGVSAFGWNR